MKENKDLIKTWIGDFFPEIFIKDMYGYRTSFIFGK